MKPPDAVPPSVDEDVRVYAILTKEGDAVPVVPYLMAKLPEIFMESKTSLSFVTCRELYVMLGGSEAFLGLTLRYLADTTLSTQICCVCELKLRFFFGHHD